MNDLLKRQIAEAEALEQHQREVMLKPIRAIASELGRTLRDLPKDSPAINHYGAIALQINNLFSALDPESQLSSLPYIAGYTEALEEAARLGAESFPFINLQVLSQTRSESVEKIRAVNNEAKLKVFESLQVSLALGEGAFDTAKRLEETGIRNTYWKYERIARTSTTDLINSAHLATYQAIAEQNPDTKWQKEYIAVGDIRTSDICLKSDGEIRDFDKTFSNGVLRPPAHPNCRSRITLVAKDKEVKDSPVDAKPIKPVPPPKPKDSSKSDKTDKAGKTTNTKKEVLKELKKLGVDLRKPNFTKDDTVNSYLERGYQLAQRIAPDLLSAMQVSIRHEVLMKIPENEAKDKELLEEFWKFRQKLFDAGNNKDPKIPLIAIQALKLGDMGKKASDIVQGYLGMCDPNAILPEKLKIKWGTQPLQSQYDPNTDVITLTPLGKTNELRMADSLIHELTHAVNFGSIQREVAVEYGKQRVTAKNLIGNDPYILDDHVIDFEEDHELTDYTAADVRFNATLGYRKYASRVYPLLDNPDVIYECEILSSASELLTTPAIFQEYLRFHVDEFYLFLGTLSVDL